MHTKKPANTQAARVAFGHGVRAARTRRKISQEDFAELADVHRNYIGRVERAEINLSFDTMHRIARALGFSLAELCRRSGV